jgi:hypothetical protein
MKKRLYCLFLVVLMAGCNPVFGRVSGMGGLIVATVSGGQSLWYNPAGLTEGRSEIASSLSIAKFYDVDFSDIGFYVPEFSSCLNLGKGNAVGVGYMQGSYTGDVMGDIGLDDNTLMRQIAVGYSHRLGDWLSLGVNIRPYWAKKLGDTWYYNPADYIEDEPEEEEPTAAIRKATGDDNEPAGEKTVGVLMFDSGFIYSLTETVKLGFSVFNITRPDIVHLFAPRLPTVWNIGLSNKIWDCLTYEVVYSISDYKIKESLDSSQVGLGLGWTCFDWLSIYGGAGQLVESSDRSWLASIGTEGKIPLGDSELAIGYDLNYLQETVWTHTINIFYRWGEGKAETQGYKTEQPRYRQPKPRKERQEYDW